MFIIIIIIIFMHLKYQSMIDGNTFAHVILHVLISCILFKRQMIKIWYFTLFSSNTDNRENDLAKSGAANTSNFEAPSFIGTLYLQSIMHEFRVVILRDFRRNIKMINSFAYSFIHLPFVGL